MNENTETRYCKKCGCELMSTNKKKLCADCFRKRNEKLQKIGLYCMSVITLISGYCIKGKNINRK